MKKTLTFVGSNLILITLMAACNTTYNDENARRCESSGNRRGTEAFSNCMKTIAEAHKNASDTVSTMHNNTSAR